jgi:hypothetical protein
MKRIILSAVLLLVWNVLAPRTAQAQTPTFSEHIAPIIFKNCTSCHRDGEVAPFALTNYQQTRQRARMIKSVTQSKYMPPWKPAHGYGAFADARSLAESEIALIAQWVDGGTPEGDASKTPPVPSFPSGSQLGTPDLVLKLSQPYRISSNNKDEYRNFVLPSGVIGDRVISAIEFRPGNPKVVHHALIYADTSGMAQRLDAQDAKQGYEGFGGPGFTAAYFYFGWVPGQQARFLPSPMGMRLPNRADIVVQIHYAPSAVEQEDQSSINIFFAKDPVKTRYVTIQNMSPAQLGANAILGFLSFVIPPNRVSTFKGQYRVASDLSLIAIAPHQHLLGRSAQAYAVTRQNDTIPIIRVDDWDFQWQGSYTLKRPLKIPAGATVYYEASYDNTTNNWRNPNNPPRTTRWGENTSDEMYLCYFATLPYQAGDENISLEGSVATSVNAHTASMTTPRLRCAPNPASELASLTVELPTSLPVWLEVFDPLGRRVATLMNGETLGAGTVSIPLNVSGQATGVYVCRLRAGKDVVTQTVQVVR